MDKLKRAERYFHQALDQHCRGQWAAAEALYRSALAHAPGRHSVLLNLSAVLIEQHRFDEARPLCEQVLAEEPDNADALSQLGCCLRTLAGPERAIDPLRRAIEKRPDDFQSHCILGAALAELDRCEEALAHFDRALKAMPGEPHTLGHRARMLVRLGRPGDALADCLQALARDPACRIAGQALRELLEDDGQPPPVRTPALDAALLRAADAPWAGPMVASGLVRRLLRSQPGLSTWLARARVAWPERLPAERVLGDDAVREALSDPLLAPLLGMAPILDGDFRPWLAGVRHALAHTVFERRSEEGDGDVLLALHCAIGRQCALNGYAWETTHEEDAIVERLRKVLRAALLSGHAPPARWIAAAACYGPLSEFPGIARLDTGPMPAALRNLLGEARSAAPPAGTLH